MWLIKFAHVPSEGNWSISDGTNTVLLDFSITASGLGSAMDAASLAGGPYTGIVTGDFSSGFLIPTTGPLFLDASPGPPGDAVTIARTQAGSAGTAGTSNVWHLDYENDSDDGPHDGSAAFGLIVDDVDFGVVFWYYGSSASDLQGFFVEFGISATISDAEGGGGQDMPQIITFAGTDEHSIEIYGDTGPGATASEITPASSGGSGQNEKQQLTIDGIVSGGSFNLILPDTTFLGFLADNINDSELQGFITGISTYASATVSALEIDYGVQTSLTLALVDGSGLTVDALARTPATPLSYSGTQLPINENAWLLAFNLNNDGSQFYINVDGTDYGFISNSAGSTPAAIQFSLSMPDVLSFLDAAGDPNGTAMPYVLQFNSAHTVTTDSETGSPGDSISAATAQNQQTTLTLDASVTEGTFTVTPIGTTSTPGEPWNVSAGSLESDLLAIVSGTYPNLTVSGSGPYVIDWGVESQFTAATGFSADGSGLLAPVLIELVAVLGATAGVGAEQGSASLDILAGWIGTGHGAESGRGIIATTLIGTGRGGEHGAATLTETIEAKATAHSGETGTGTLRVLILATGTGRGAEGGSSSGFPRIVTGSGREIETGSGRLQITVETSAVGRGAANGSGTLRVTTRMMGVGAGAETIDAELAIPPILKGTGTAGETGAATLQESLRLKATATAADQGEAHLNLQRPSRYQMQVVGQVCTHGLMAGMVAA